jgi:hypothetical protein
MSVLIAPIAMTAMSEMLHHAALPTDQASTLRRMFPVAGPWLVPFLVPTVRNDRHGSVLAQLAGTLARCHGRVLAIDAARVQLGAACGVPLRRELADVLAGEAPLAGALVRANAGTNAGQAPALHILAAARAIESAAAQGQALDQVLSAAGVALDAFDAILVALPASHSACLLGVDCSAMGRAGAPGEALVPVAATAAGIQGALAAIRCAHGEADIGIFRLLFTGMDPAAARTVFERMAQTEIAVSGTRLELRFGGVFRAGSDPAQLAPAPGGWDLMRIDRVRDHAGLEQVT